MDRPQVITRQTLENPPAEQTTNIQRGQAFAHDGVWAGFVVFPGGASTGWHHHGGYATYGYVTSGGMMVEFGPGGSELVEIGEGDFIYIPGHLVHRESVAPDGGAGVIVRVGGAVPPCSTSRDQTRQHHGGVALGVAPAGPILGSHDLVWTRPNRCPRSAGQTHLGPVAMRRDPL